MIDRLVGGVEELVILSALFSALSLIVHGLARRWWMGFNRAEWRTNLTYFFSDLFVLVPVLGMWTVFLENSMADAGLRHVLKAEVRALPDWLALLLAIALSDLVGYWRHRLMHWGPLWPIHAAHHSDRDVSWLTLVRFHPLNRFVAVTLNALVLVFVGFPAWAVVMNGLVRHFYGYFVHAALPWRYGPLRYIFVSPHLHRWHHADDPAAYDTNFATVFSLFDVVFGTFYCPERAAPGLGVGDTSYPQGWWGQTLYPFRVWGRTLRVRFAVSSHKVRVGAE